MTNTIRSIGQDIVVSIALSQFDRRSIEEALAHAGEAVMMLGAVQLVDGVDRVREAFARREVRTAQWSFVCQALRVLADADERLAPDGRAADLRALAERIASTEITAA